MDSTFKAHDLTARNEHVAAGAVPITYSVFRSVSEIKSVDTHASTWGELIELIQTPKPFSSKRECPLLKLASFGDRRNAAGSLRHDDNVDQVFGIEGDYDANEVEPAEGARRLREAGVRGVIYTSATHRVICPKKNPKGGPRWRVLAPLSGPVAPELRAELASLLNGALGGILAGESWARSQTFYFGAVKGVEYETHVVDGDPLDMFAYCPSFDPIGPPVAPRAAAKLAVPRRKQDADTAEVAHLRSRLLITAERADGAVDVLCPRWEMHGTESATSGSTWFPAGVGGRSEGGFECRHHSCGKPTTSDFLNWSGLDKIVTARTINDFDAVEQADDADQAARQRNMQREAALLPREVVTMDGAVELVESPAASDDALALDFAAAEQHRLRNALGLGWMVNVGTHWQRDDGLHRMDAARALCRAAANLSQKVPERKALASAKTVAAVVRLAESDRRLLVPPSAWDSDLFALNTPAGVVDLRTGALRPRTADDLVTRCTRVAPDFAAAAPTWCRFLDGVTCGDRDLAAFVERMLGYMLTGDRREQKLFFVHGPGANGKSVLGELVLWLIGTYGLKIGGDVLMSAKHERHPTELAQLRGARVAISSELEEGAFFNEPRVKELTGDDTLSARFMRGDFFEFAQTHKHLVIGNHKPRLRGGDPAMARRMVLIPFRAVFSGPTLDPDMPGRLRGEAPAILARLARGAADWHTSGLGIPAAVNDASAEYMAAHDDVQSWIDERCERSTDAKGKSSELYADFAGWKDARGERAPSVVTGAERLQLVPGVRRVRDNGAKYCGLALRSGSAAEDFA